MNINRIYADLFTAYNNLEIASDEYIIDIAAYHTQQAIEKSLKYYLHNLYGVNEEDANYKIHNIANLIKQICRFDPKFAENNHDLIACANKLTIWEASTRYSHGIISNVKGIKKYLKIADRLYNNIKKIEEERIKNIIEQCKKDPFYIKNIKHEFQNKEIINACLDGCRNCKGVNPSDIIENVNDQYKEITSILKVNGLLQHQTGISFGPIDILQL